MIDWANVLSNSLWIGGLALFLASLSLQHLRADATVGKAGRGPSILPALLGSSAVRLAGLCVCAGLALVRTSSIEKGLWLLIGLYIIYRAWQSSRLGTGQVSGVSHQYDEPGMGTQRGVPPRSPVPGPSSVSEASSRLSPAIVWASEWLVRTELLWLVVLSPFFLAPELGMRVAGLWPLVVLPLLWAARRMARGRFVPATPMDIALIFLLVALLVSLFATFDLTLSLGSVTGLLFGVCLYYALVEWTSAAPTRLRWAFSAYAVGGAALAVIGLLGTNWVSKISLLNHVAAQLPTLVKS